MTNNYLTKWNLAEYRFARAEMKQLTMKYHVRMVMARFYLKHGNDRMYDKYYNMAFRANK